MFNAGLPLARSALWVLALAALGFCAKTLYSGPPSPAVAALVFSGYAAIMTAGVLLPGMQMFTSLIQRVPVQEPWLALTFDDGPDPHTTPRILEILSAHRCRATFFVIGDKARRYPELVRKIRAQGHALGLHSYHHPWLFSLWPAAWARRDIQRTQAELFAITGEQYRLLRPPLGFIGPGTARAARHTGVVLVGFSARGLDGIKHAAPDAVVRRLLPGLEPGAVVLMHDALEYGSGEPAAVAALPAILAALRARGLSAVTLPELLSKARWPSAEPGVTEQEVARIAAGTVFDRD